MADERVEWIRRELDRWNSGSRDLEFERLDPEFELDSALLAGTLHGEQGIRRWIEEIDQQFDAWNIEIREERPVGDDRVLWLCTLRARGKGSGLEMDQDFGFLLTFRGEKLVRMKTYMSQAEARTDSGLDDSE